MMLGVIGYGHRMSLFMKEVVKRNAGCQVVAVTDPMAESLKEHFAAEGSHFPRIYSDPDDMLDTERLDGVLIGTRCSLHTTMALKVLARNLPLFLEKPVATSLDDWLRLKSASAQSTSSVVVSFPLRFTPIVRLARELLESGKIGKVEHVQSVNNVPYGGTYYHNWYRDEQETGGLFLQKTTHDFDYIQYLIGETPQRVCAIASKQIFKGDRPAGMRCSACEDRACQERVTPFGIVPARPNDYCCFAKDTGNEDSSSVLVQYESGMHLSYTQNFFARRKAAVRGTRLIGYRGTIEFDFYTSRLSVYLHHTSRTETYDIDTTEPHFGGDPYLAQNFIDVVEGRAPSQSTLDDGLLSALMCLKSKESAATHTFQDIGWQQAPILSQS
ncbi:Gfo/Idh/MocA family protein [Paenibacillus sp. GYB003]|uniref:Gfo/Idh/MocA family protein n=1 Tax=Paenibacillus sp. GYB003 TaxID=2994392 RepID=UPI002F960C49